MSIKDFVAQDNNSLEHDVLNRKLFDVNIRFFRNNEQYRGIILDICNYMAVAMEKSFDDYPYVSGISGANLHIPFNIIAYRDGGKKKGKPVIMINPVVIGKSKETRTIESNCGSLILKEKIKVERNEEVTVKYWDISGKSKTETFTLSNGGGTIQHEIEHNMGVLITTKSMS